MKSFTAGVVLFLLICNNLKAQESVFIKRISETVTFNGIPDEPLWGGLNKFDLTMHSPTFGLSPSEISDVRMGYDDEFLWIGAKLFMKDASKIFSPTKRRDEDIEEYDAFGIILDTYDDNENALAFFTNPFGLRSDYAISNDGEGGGGGPNSSMNSSWNTFWDVKTAVDDKGWYVEMRIPFSSLKFKPEGDIAAMGLILVRHISLNNETDSYPAIDPKFGHDATNKPSLAAGISISGARPKKPVYISPYVKLAHQTTGLFHSALILLQDSSTMENVQGLKWRLILTFHPASEWKQHMNSMPYDSPEGPEATHSTFIQ